MVFDNDGNGKVKSNAFSPDDLDLVSTEDPGSQPADAETVIADGIPYISVQPSDVQDATKQFIDLAIKDLSLAYSPSTEHVRLIRYHKGHVAVAAQDIPKGGVTLFPFGNYKKQGSQPASSPEGTLSAKMMVTTKEGVSALSYAIDWKHDETPALHKPKGQQEHSVRWVKFLHESAKKSKQYAEENESKPALLTKAITTMNRPIQLVSNAEFKAKRQRTEPMKLELQYYTNLEPIKAGTPLALATE